MWRSVGGGSKMPERLSLSEMKSEIQRRVGAINAYRYFTVLGRYLSSKMSKIEFDRICVRSIGKENLSLHNRFIRTILNNAMFSEERPVKKRRVVGPLSVEIGEGYKGSCVKALCEDGFPVSPRKRRTSTPRGRKFRDKLSPPGPLEKVLNLVSEGSPSVAVEQSGATEVLSVGSRPPVEVNFVEDGEEVEQRAVCPSVRSTSPVRAPFGMCIYGRRNKRLLSNSLYTRTFSDTCFNLGELPDTNSLRERLENTVKAEGLDISVDFMNCLNHGVDAFLKRLISPALELARSRTNKAVNHKEVHDMMAYGLNRIFPPRYSNKPIKPVTSSALDFRVAMELNPTFLGEDWPIHLENISLRTSDD